MKTIADTRRLTLARRLACDLPPWAVARASNMSTEDLEAVMVERGGGEKIIPKRPEQLFRIGRRGNPNPDNWLAVSGRFSNASQTPRHTCVSRTIHEPFVISGLARQ